MYYFIYKIMNFSERITTELETRGWSRREAARRGDISPSMFDKVINGYAKPGIKFIKGIAKAFGISLVEVLNWLEPSAETDDQFREMIGLLVDQLPTQEDKDDVAEYIRLRLRIAEERGKYETVSKKRPSKAK